ncbi:VOC family protein [Salinigranum salinum]|uniref:VOC family protein n=1 Tax=Salinigranum salinum TaxID=1364937 RepID=UPI001260F93C|nr:VOC family protein [Salinigranum salinum]
MSQARLNHVSIVAHDMAESLEFYQGVFGLEHIPSPNFQTDVEWLRAGDLQLHLFERDVPAPRYHHFALYVDDFETVYRTVKERGIITDITDDQPEDRVYVLPDGAVQMYIEDPAGNLVEVNYHDATELDESVVTDLVHREELTPDIGAGRAGEARLFTEAFLRAGADGSRS